MIAQSFLASPPSLTGMREQRRDRKRSVVCRTNDSMSRRAVVLSGGVFDVTRAMTPEMASSDAMPSYARPVPAGRA